MLMSMVVAGPAATVGAGEPCLGVTIGEALVGVGLPLDAATIVDVSVGAADEILVADAADVAADDEVGGAHEKGELPFPMLSRSLASTSILHRLPLELSSLRPILL